MVYASPSIPKRDKVVARDHGYVSLKEEQLLVMDKFAIGSDMFVTMPTGFGLLVYGLLLTVFNCLQGYTDPTSVTLVVSPLASLIVHCTVVT